MKAQASLEQLVVIGAALAFIAIAFYIAASMSAESIKLAQAQDSVERLASAADYVYSIGPNTKEYVTVFLPAGIISTNTTGKRVLISLSTTAGSTDVYENTRADLTGTLEPKPGRQKVLVEYLPTGKVRLGEAGLTCYPSYIVKQLNAGDTAQDALAFSNNAEFNVTGISFNYTGSAKDFTTLGLVPGSLLAGESANSTLSYDIPAQTQSGVYGGVISLDSANGGSCTIQVSLKVNGVPTCAGLCANGGYATGTCRASPSQCVANGEDYSSPGDIGCAGGSPSCCCGPTQDFFGPIVTSIYHTPENASTADNVSIYATCNDSETGGLYISSSMLQVDGGAWISMNATDGTFSDSVIESSSAFVGMLAAGQHIAIVKCADTANNTGPLGYYYFNVSLADVYGPIITKLNHTESAPTTLVNLTEDATATDYFTGNNDITACYMKLRSPGGVETAWLPIPASDGAYDSPTEDFSHDFGQLSSGIHTISAYCTDSKGNNGGQFNDTFGVVTVDMMLIIDRSGSMAWPITNYTDGSLDSTKNTDLTLVKSLVVGTKNGDLANVSIETRTDTSGCSALYEARIGSNVIASGNRTSTSYGYNYFYNINISAYSPPYTVDFYLAKYPNGGCTAYMRGVGVTQMPDKMQSAQDAADYFVDIVSNTSKVGLVSYSSSGTTDMQLADMSSIANKNSLKSAINALYASGGTCIECGLDNAVTELISSRGRSDSVRVAILLTDGVSNYGNSVDGAVYARNNNVTVYTIGLGNDVDDTELTNIALLTNGKYYKAPDAATLLQIYSNIGQ
ncbi:MAG: VWA domain-containing protein [Candidatus Micrarchaeia archaeon]